MTDTSASDLARETDQISASLGDLTSLSRGFGSALTSAFKGAALQGKDLDSVLRGIASRLASSAFDRAFQPLATSVTSGLGSMLGLPGFQRGGVFSGGRVTPFAQGGVVSSPSFFPMASGRLGLMGEAGPEAILPLTRGADGRLGVAARGGGGTVNITMNVTTPDVEGFARSEAQLQTMLARAVGRGRRGL
jgi:phage-related minor tail protein